VIADYVIADTMSTAKIRSLSSIIQVAKTTVVASLIEPNVRVIPAHVHAFAEAGSDVSSIFLPGREPKGTLPQKREENNWVLAYKIPGMVLAGRARQIGIEEFQRLT
jgi:hypothetical protein